MASLSNAEITNKSVHKSDNPVRKSAIVDTSKLKVLQEQSAEEVGEWLDDQGFGAYSQNFVDNNVNGECVPLLSKQDLLDIGVTKVGDRLRMLRHMREYKVALEVQQRTKVLLRWLEFRWFCSPFDTIYYILTPSTIECNSVSGCFGSEKITIDISSITDISYESNGCFGACCYSVIRIMVTHGEDDHVMRVKKSSAHDVYQAIKNCWEAYQANRAGRFNRLTA